jgi:hypothetical protein
MVFCQRGPRDANSRRDSENLSKVQKDRENNRRSADASLLVFLVLMNQSEKKGDETKMADFVQKTTVRTAVRELANPIADVAADPYEF